MTLDKLVTNDLRALATASRQALVPLERSIAAVAPRASCVYRSAPKTSPPV